VVLLLRAATTLSTALHTKERGCASSLDGAGLSAPSGEDHAASTVQPA
jgi:hypothetical protein